MNDYEVPWPNVLSGFWNLAGAASTVPVSASFVTCTLQLSYFARFWIAALSPVCAGIALLVIPITSKLLRRGSAHWGRYRTALLCVCYLLFPTVVREAVRTLKCSDSIDGKAYLEADFRVECGTAIHAFHVVAATIVLLGFCLGFPIMTGVTLYRRFRSGTLESAATRKRFDFLMSGFKPERAYWESVVMLRKGLVVTVAATLATEQAGHQVAAGTFVVACSLGAQLALQPYEHRRQSRLENASLAAAFVSLYVGQLLALKVSAGVAAVAATVAVLVNMAFVVLCLQAICRKGVRSRGTGCSWLRRPVDRGVKLESPNSEAMRANPMFSRSAGNGATGRAKEVPMQRRPKRLTVPAPMLARRGSSDSLSRIPKARVSAPPRRAPRVSSAAASTEAAQRPRRSIRRSRPPPPRTAVSEV